LAGWLVMSGDRAACLRMFDRLPAKSETVTGRPRSATIPSPEDLDEHVATREDYPLVLPLLPHLRNKGDPKPALVAPFKKDNVIGMEHAARLDCLSNTYEYCRLHPGATPVMCFKIWIAPQGAIAGVNAISAQLHFMPLHDGKYLEVTPPEMGDDGKVFMIVPTSRAHSDYTPEAILHMHHAQRLRMLLGGVFYPEPWRVFQEEIRSSIRAKADATELELYARPFITDLPTYVPRGLYAQLAEESDGQLVLYKLSTLLTLIDAKRWPQEDKEALLVV
jgi:hypothetical protein